MVPLISYQPPTTIQSLQTSVADPGGFHWFPRKPPLKNDCVTIKCFNYRGVRLDRDTVIRAVTVATKVVCRKFLIYFMYYY